MGLFFTDYPKYVSIKEYKNAIDEIVSRLGQYNGLVSVYQIGGINQPGISDIDLLAVFKDGVKCLSDPLKGISKTQKYLFIHSLYGVSKEYFYKAQNFTFFHNYTLLDGENLISNQISLTKSDIKTLKCQIALEYLIKMYTSITVELTYQIVRIRTLLLHAKALIYDLEFLDVTNGVLFELLQKIVLWRDNWFKDKKSKRELTIWLKGFYKELTEFLKTVLNEKGFYLPEMCNHRISKNMTLVMSEKFGYSHRGFTLPSVFGGLGRRYFNIQHNWNNFLFYVPIKTPKDFDILARYFQFLSDIKNQNMIFLPNFLQLSSSLNF